MRTDSQLKSRATPEGDRAEDVKGSRPSLLEILIVTAVIVAVCALFIAYCAYAPDPYQEYRQQRL